MITAIIQARMGSTRLPNKVLMDILGKPMLWHIINRVKRCKKINDIVVATTEKEEDGQIIKLAQETGVKSFDGSENDVLDRYYQAAKINSANVIVRVTGDCPLVDSKIIDRTVEYFLNNNCDYVSTGHITKEQQVSKYPDGLDTEVFSFQALERAWKGAELPSDREHATSYIWKNPEIFKCKSLELNGGRDFSPLRWTVDEKRDLKFVREVYKRLYKEGKIFLMEDVIALLEREPELLRINSDIKRDDGYLKSIKEDK